MPGTGAPLRANPYTGGSAMAAPFPGTSSGPATTTPPAKKAPAKKRPARPRAGTVADYNDRGEQGESYGQFLERTKDPAYMRGRTPKAATTPAPAGAPTGSAPAGGGDGFAWGDVLAPPGSGDAAGFLLGLLIWGWVVLPFLKSGTTGVKDVWRAKFLNKGPDGSWLP